MTCLKACSCAGVLVYFLRDHSATEGKLLASLPNVMPSRAFVSPHVICHSAAACAAQHHVKPLQLCK